MIRKASQFWIEDPLRKVSQPVLFITQAGSEADITGKDGLGAMFVRNARIINSRDLPLFQHSVVNSDGVKFTYSRIFDRESVLIEVPYKAVKRISEVLYRQYVITKLVPAFEISDDSGNILGLVVCDGDGWTESGKYYAVSSDAVDPFEYGNWMCYYDSKPFSGDLEDKVIYSDRSATITEVAPCGYHGTVVPHEEYSFESITDPSIDRISQSMCVLSETIDTGTITLSDGSTTIHNIVDSLTSLTYNPNFIYMTIYLPYYNRQLSLSHNSFDAGPEYSYVSVFGSTVTSAHSELSSSFCTSITIGVGTEITSEYYREPSEIMLVMPTISNYYNSEIWSAIYASGMDSYTLFDAASETITAEDTSSSIDINLIVSGNIFSSFSIANTATYGSNETLARAIFYAPLLSSLRMYSYGDAVYVIGSLMEYESVNGETNSSPKSTYFFVKLGDSEVQTLSLDSLYTSGSIPYNQTVGGSCYGKFRLVKIEEKVEVEDV
jgi:hypothetical protein